MNRHYVYTISVDGVVRYIGKGSGWRVKQHFAIARRLAAVVRAAGGKIKASYFHNKLSKEISGGAIVASALIAERLNEDEAYELERVQIAAAPKGQLWNRWSGGLGSRTASPELRETFRNAARHRYSEDPEQLDTLLRQIRLVAGAPRFRAAMAARQKARFAAGDPAMLRFSDSGHRPEVYIKRGRTLSQTYKNRPELIVSSTAKSRAWWADSENKASVAAKLKAAHARSDVKAKRRAYYDSPEGRAKLAAASMARWQKHGAGRAVVP